MIASKTRVAVMAASEVTTDIPEHRDLYQAFPGTDWNKRARGLGATPERPASSCAEENLLCQASDLYAGEDILIHEFAHTIHVMGLNGADASFDTSLRELYQKAKDKGLWTNTYAISDYREYWAEGVQDWFNANREAVPSDGVHNQINTRSELQAYDPELYAFVSRYFSDDTTGSCQAKNNR
ncbi:MAG: hypothetical protein MUD08_04760 [Cytophagales bacterium]|nr:hypothetical protein [Cytophagales bacterium]